MAPPSVPQKRDTLKSSDTGDCHLGDLYKMLHNLLGSKPNERPLIQEEEAEDPKVCQHILYSIIYPVLCRTHSSNG